MGLVSAVHMNRRGQLCKAAYIERANVRADGIKVQTVVEGRINVVAYGCNFAVDIGANVAQFRL